MEWPRFRKRAHLLEVCEVHDRERADPRLPKRLPDLFQQVRIQRLGHEDARGRHDDRPHALNGAAIDIGDGELVSEDWVPADAHLE
jgi:hypothetical protein